MNTVEKLKILGAGARYDACSCYPPQYFKADNDRIGESIGCAITHSATPDGKPVSLFKVLYTNSCIFDCKYCANRRSNNKETAIFEKEELAKTFMSLYVRNYVEGLFLSSGIIKDSDYTAELMLGAVSLLRNKYKFKGYIHTKILPGTSECLIKQIAECADRISINLEAPNNSRMKQLSSNKDYKIDILRRQRWMRSLNVSAGRSTQFVIGAADENDEEILDMANWEYKNMRLQKAYYSAFNPVQNTPLETHDKTPLTREVKLYRADFLIRSYKYDLKEIKSIMANGMLPEGDPKLNIALASMDSPIDLNRASYSELLKVPGIGHRSSQRIMELQRNHVKIENFEQLRNIGIVLKRARNFIKMKGYQTRLTQFREMKNVQIQH